MDLRGGRAERAFSPSLPHHSLLMLFSAAARGGSSHRDHSLLRQLLMMKKIRATISSVSRTPAKKAKIKCSFLFWQREGVGELLAGASCLGSHVGRWTCSHPLLGKKHFAFGFQGHLRLSQSYPQDSTPQHCVVLGTHDLSNLGQC